MSKLLQTRLPLAEGETVTPDTFNRLVRILEINLGSIDPDAIQVFNSTEISELQFATGAIIFNSTTEVHQAFDGTEFRNLYEHQTYLVGLSATISLGTVTVSTP
jgi:hypothetical protein|tara:strand:- start:1752 stop:2063 length:312 start_codon:yes stop_codon:yes gene_type:complete